jgi:hypothetical protein
LSKEDGERISGLVKTELRKELQSLVEKGEVSVGGSGEVWGKVPERGLKL